MFDKYMFVRLYPECCNGGLFKIRKEENEKYKLYKKYMWFRCPTCGNYEEYKREESITEEYPGWEKHFTMKELNDAVDITDILLQEVVLDVNIKMQHFVDEVDSLSALADEIKYLLES